MAYVIFYVLFFPGQFLDKDSTELDEDIYCYQMNNSAVLSNKKPSNCNINCIGCNLKKYKLKN